MKNSNNRKLYYITRTYLPTNTGGALMRAGAVQLLSHSFDVTVITIGEDTEIIDGIEVVRLPFTKNPRLMFALERIGVLEDYLQSWSHLVFNYLKEKVTKNDIVFCTTGGELASLKAGQLLKEYCGSKFIANFRDPLIYSKVNGLKINNKFHVSRERAEHKCLTLADLIITSSKTNELSLKEKYPDLSSRIVNNYFGYIEEYEISKAKNDYERLRFAYGGRFGHLQAPEIWAEAFVDIPNVELYFIGNYLNYKPIIPYLNRYHFIAHMKHDEYQQFLQNNIDVGLLSLSSDYLGACIPAKFYEYINMGLPMLGALPEGDAKNLINQNGYGIACNYNKNNEIKNAILKFSSNKGFVASSKQSILATRKKWSMESLVDKLVNLINNLE